MHRFVRQTLPRLVMIALALASSIGRPSAAETAASGAYAELPGVKLWFTDTGGPGTPIVLLHANTGTSAVWESQIAAFSRAGYRVIAFDRRGWGRSLADPATGPQPGSIAGDLDALADHLKLGPFHLLGVAGGGFAALDYAGGVRSGFGASWSVRAPDGCRRRKWPISLPGSKFPASGNCLLSTGRSALLSWRDPEGTQRWIESTNIPTSRERPISRCARRTRSRRSRRSRADARHRRRRRPACTAGPDARLGRPREKSRMGDRADSGHAIAWEHPDAFNEKVVEFLSRH